MIASYLRLIVFAYGLLIGVQIPAFVDQYAKRVSAHYIEVVADFKGFQDTANQYFGGNIEALINHHASSGDPAFRSEANSIRTVRDRLVALRAELDALHGSLVRQILHVVFQPNRAILEETRVEYTYTVPLNPAAIVTGVTIATGLALVVELVLVGGLWLLRPRRTAPTARYRA